MPVQNDNNLPDYMGRPPINDVPMTPAERQRRRRHRLNKEPWHDPGSLAWAVLAALRDLRAEEGAFEETQIAALIDRAAEEFGNKAGNAEQIVAALERFLDPAEPLPVRGQGRRGGGRGHRFGDQHRERRLRRRAKADTED